jgi:hypothetical protein
MTDKPLSAHSFDLPPCPLSAHCWRLVDELDGYDATGWTAVDVLEEDSSDMLLVQQLRAHMEYCPTCSETLRQARILRAQQRSLLRGLLAEGEQRVPPTTDHTLRAIRREPAPGQSERTVALGAERAETESATWRTLAPVGERSRRMPRRSARILQGALSLAAAAALIIASLSLFSHLVMLRSNSAGKAPALRTAPAPVAGWSSVVMTFVRGNSLMVVNEDPADNTGVTLASVPTPKTADLDSISHDGQRLLYRIYNSQQTKTTYTFQPQSPGPALYILAGKGGHTVWSTDDRYVFISAPRGVRQVDARSGALVREILPSTPSPDIRFYYGGFLYYLVSQNGIAGVLNRVNITGGATQSVTTCPLGHDFWLSPSGKTIYYYCDGQNALYAVNTDGSNANIVRNNAGWLIGYATDNSLLTLRNVGARYQVVKMGTTPAQDRVLLDGLAPGAAYIAPGSVAVAPYGRALVARAIYADGHEELWYGDLTSGKQFRLSIPAGAKLLALKGWDRLQVPGTPPPSGPQSFSDWHSVLVAENNDKIGWSGLVNIDAYSGTDTLLTAAKLPPNTRVDGVSSDGNTVLYQYSSQGTTAYLRLPRPGSGAAFYIQPDSMAGNAIWMPDSRHALVLTIGEGVMEVDTQSGQSVNIIPLPMSSVSGQQVEIARLAFYRDGYLYFVGGQGACEGELCRIQIGAAGAVAHPVTFRASNTSYWLSPDGTTVYFANRQGPAGKSGIYAVNSDGTHMRLLRPYADAAPIGYAADMSLEIMRYVNGKFVVVKLGATPQADSVVLADAAPGAASLCNSPNPPGVSPICDSNIALAPLGGMLMLNAGYADGSYRLWSINLQTGKRLQIASPLPQPGTQLQLIGWDRISVPAG